MFKKLLDAVAPVKNLLDTKFAIRNQLSGNETVKTLNEKKVPLQILSDNDKNKPYAKYFEINMAEVNQDSLALLFKTDQ